MSLTAQAPNGTRWWLILGDPTLPPVSVKKPVTIPDSYWDAPCMFSRDRATAWQIVVSNQGHFFATPAPLSRAAFDYVEFIGNDRISRVLQISNLGELITA